MAFGLATKYNLLSLKKIQATCCPNEANKSEA